MLPSQLASRIATAIQDLIVTERLGPEAHLSTQKLADQFGVSRSPVREALGMLAERGILEQRANRGFFVRAGGAKRPDGEVAPAPNGGDASVLVDEPPAYFQMAQEWLRDAIPAEVTAQFLRERYDLTNSQVTAILTHGIHEGWIERKPGYGWRLLPVAKTPEALDQLYRLRMAIEPAALLEPTFVLDRDTLAAQRQIHERMLAGAIEHTPTDRLVQIGAQFHEAIIKLSRNPFFHQTLVRVDRMRRLIDYQSRTDRHRFYEQWREHLELIELIGQGDNVAASVFMRRHIAGALRTKAEFLRSHPLLNVG